MHLFKIKRNSEETTWGRKGSGAGGHDFAVCGLVVESVFGECYQSTVLCDGREAVVGLTGEHEFECAGFGELIVEVLVGGG